jgi:hypothetical protein
MSRVSRARRDRTMVRLLVKVSDLVGVVVEDQWDGGRRMLCVGVMIEEGREEVLGTTWCCWKL